MMREIDQQLSREYAQQRTQNEHEREARIAEAIARDQAIGALQDELRQRFARSTRELMADRARAQELSQSLKLDVARIQLEIGYRLTALGLPADHFELRYRCGECRDTGFLGEFSQQMCNCYKLRRVRLMREHANLGGSAEGQSFEAFDESVFPEGEQRRQALAAMRRCMKYADELPHGKLNLILMGESGLGKTYLLNSVAGRAIQNGVPALSVTAFHMLAAMREYHFGQTGDSAPLNQMIRCELLLIDDLGTEPMLRNITVEYLFMLLNERINARRHTAIATNLGPAELQERYNERVFSRLMDRQNGEFIRLSGVDIRFRER